MVHVSKAFAFIQMCHKSDLNLRQQQKQIDSKPNDESAEDENEEIEMEEVEQSEEDANGTVQERYTIAELPVIKYEEECNFNDEVEDQGVQVDVIYETEMLDEYDETGQESLNQQEVEEEDEEGTMLEYDESLNLEEEIILGDSNTYETSISYQQNRRVQNIPKSAKRGRKPASNRNCPRPAAGPPFKCAECHKVLSNMNSYKYHMQLHSDETPFLCKNCGAQFKTRNAFDGHMITHAEVNPHTCTVCNKSYRQAASLRNHMLSHSGLKPFKCEICGKGMTQRSGYKVFSYMFLEFCRQKYNILFLETHVNAFG